MALGNDIVDLASPHVTGKGQDPRFIRKILTSREQEYLNNSDRPDRVLWHVWAAKESAYKALSRHHPHISSAPKSFDVSFYPTDFSSMTNGIVHTPMENLSMSSWSDKDKICCICMNSVSPSSLVLDLGVEGMEKGMALDYDQSTAAQSLLVRKKALLSLASYSGESIDDIAIERPQNKKGHTGPPEVWIKGKKTDMTLSLSHDGRFVFFVWVI